MKIFKLFLIFILSSQLALADLCGFVFSPGPRVDIASDMKLLGKINRLESLTTIVRKLRGRGAEENVLMMKKFREEFKLIEGQLFKGEIDIAQRTWQGLFRKVESNALEAKNYGRMIRALNKGIRVNIKDYDKFLKDEGIPKYLISQHINELEKVGPEEYLKNLNKSLRKSYRKLGNGFAKYKFVREELSKLKKSASCTPLCQQSLKDLDNSIGIMSQSERHLHQDLIQYRRSLSLKTVEDIFNAHPEAIAIAKRKEFINESIGLLKKYFNNTRLMRRLYYTLGDSAAGKNLRLVRMFKRAFDRRALTLNKGVINKVSYSDLSGKGKMELLKTESKDLDFKAAMVDFSRTPDEAVQSAWKQMKDYASSSKKNAALLEQMEDAESLGKKIGRVSKKLPKDITAVISTLVVGGAFVSYFVFSTEEEEEVQGDQPRDADGAGEGPDGNDGPIILDAQDVDEVSDDDQVIILKYNSKLDSELRSQLVEIIDSLNQHTENLSSE